MKYRTIRAQVTGAICGTIWQPGAGVCGIPHTFDLRRRIERFSDPRGVTFRDALLHELMERGGDFQNARFSEDTVLTVTRMRGTHSTDVPSTSRYDFHTRTYRVADLPNCEDLVQHPETFASDFYGVES